MEKHKSIDRYTAISRIKDRFDIEKNDIMFCIIITFILGLIAHAFAFFNTNYSHDALNAIFATDTEFKWKIELGRFLVPFYQMLFRGRLALPWLIGSLSLIYMSVAVYYVNKIFEIRSRIATALIAGIMVTNLTVISQIGTYIHELDCNMLGLVFSVGAVYVWKKQCNLKGLCFATLLMFCSMGIYQSYVSVSITLIMFDLIFSLLKNEKIKSVLLRAITGIGFILIAFVMYAIISKLACIAAGVSLQERTELFVNSDAGNNILFYYIKLVFNSYIEFLYRLINTRVYGNFILLIIAGVILISLCVVAFLIFKTKQIKFMNKAIAAVIVCLLPLGMNSIYIVTHGYLHDVMIYALWLIFVLFVALVYKFSDEVFANEYLKLLVKCSSIVLVAALIWQNTVIANTLYLKKDVEAKSTLSTMTRVVMVMEQYEGYEMGVTPVAFIGTNNPYSTIDAFGQVEYITGALENNSISKDTSVYYYNAYKAYFTYVLNYPINICSDEIRAELKYNSYIETMPSFPENGCIEMIDGTMVVKLG